MISRRTFASGVTAPLAPGRSTSIRRAGRAGGPHRRRRRARDRNCPRRACRLGALLIPIIEIDDAVNAWADDAKKGFGLSAKAGPSRR